jgi:hypothetical protein
MRLPTLTLPLALAIGLPAQANDFAGLRIFSGTVGSPPTLTCGTPFTCTPTSFTLAPGDSVDAVMMGEFNSLFVIAASFNTGALVCLPLGIPGLVNNLILPPPDIFSLAVGFCSFSDNGRCNGGSPGVVHLFTIPAGIPSGSIAFQGAAGSPLSAGGSGLAFSNAVVMNF